MAHPDCIDALNQRGDWTGARRGLTRVEAIVLVVCILIALSVAFILLVSRGRPNVGRFKDSTQIRAIHQSFMVFGREFGGELPTPSAMSRLAPDGLEATDRGADDIALNTTANLHSAMIMHNYYTPAICVGPTEPNPKVSEFELYNYEAYKPASNTWWDPSFTADLQTGSNVSYASMPIYGKLRAKHWKETLGDSTWPIIGNRGPLNGLHEPKSYTLEIHPPPDRWSGNICFADNHVEFLTGLPTAKAGDSRAINTQGLFRLDGEDDSDGILTFVKSMSRDGPIIQHD